mgnify:CR=1 FL=1
MTKEFQLRVDPRTAADNERVAAFVARQGNFDRGRIKLLQILKRSIDARQRRVMVNLTVRCFIDELPDNINRYEPYRYGDVSNAQTVVVVGAGPGGLFAALRLIELGLRPVVLERGKNVDDRRRDLARISRENIVDENSNYSFGEGGAGAYSDGKLYTRSKKRGSVDRILQIFNQFGASENILIDAHPHIGSDKLPAVIKAMRQQILKSGGDVRFSTRVTGLKMDGMSVVGVVCEDGSEFDGPVILATGHSARDVYRMLDGLNIEIEAKGIAVGVRLEHPQKLIDQIQYHSKQGRGKYLPAAEYSMVTQVDGRGVYSFCMCPGGFVIPAATGPEQIVVNGMSPANRGTKWSNSGMVVELRPEDIDADNPLAVMHYQEEVEKMCWQQGNRQQTAPAQRMADFVNNRLSYDLPASSYAPGLISSPLHFWMPKPIASRLQEGFKTFGRQAHGFLTNEAVLIAMETRTSSPVRILRDRETLMHVRLQGLFPCGEGAGYAGGIVSAGVDGERCAEQCAAYLQQI